MLVHWENECLTWKTFSFSFAMNLMDARAQLEKETKNIVMGTTHPVTFLKMIAQERKGLHVRNWIRTEMIYCPNKINIYM